MTGPEHYLQAERLLADPGNLSGRRTGIVARGGRRPRAGARDSRARCGYRTSRREPGLKVMAGCCRDEALWRCLLTILGRYRA